MIYFKKKNKIEKNKGYAILFAVVIVSIISLLVAGLSNTTFKELILTSVARDSSTAFFQSDTATECALYAENGLIPSMTPSDPNSWTCGVDSSGQDITFNVGPDTNPNTNSGYQATPVSFNNNLPCFEFQVHKPTINKAGDPGTDIFAKGYNICNKTSPKTVEREIEVTY